MAELTNWPPLSPLSGRDRDVEELARAAGEGRCLSLVGMSNIGKSFVMRALCRQGSAGSPAVFIYIDCNRMVEFTDQGFYELVLRCIKGDLADAGAAPALLDSLEQCYGEVVAPSTPFLAHLRFSDGLAAACEQSAQPLILVLDEFDEVMQGIGDRVLLNLRALRDTYPSKLCYVTATRRRLGALRRSHGSGEFAELFVRHTRYLPPLGAEASAALLGEWATTGGLSIRPADEPLIAENAGGHPALLSAVCQVLDRLRAEAQAIGRPLSVTQIHEQLDSDVACQAECAKLWQELDAEERIALLQAAPASSAEDSPARRSLVERHLVRRDEPGLVPFCRLFTTFVRRQRIAQQADQRGVRVDVEAGDVWVDGRQVPPLTELEYRLLLLLYGHLDKIVDKYTVVEAVWGQSYIDQVDDSRIEKLVSRLRQKLEPDSSEPRYLLTVRGRGYRLISP